jgi:hypothetical protein
LIELGQSPALIAAEQVANHREYALKTYTNQGQAFVFRVTQLEDDHQRLRPSSVALTSTDKITASAGCRLQRHVG